MDANLGIFGDIIKVIEKIYENFRKKFCKSKNYAYLPIFDTLILRYKGPRAL